MIHDLSEHFQHKDHSYINLNNGTLGLCPDTVLQAQQKELLQFEKNTSRSLDNAWERLGNIQSELGLFFGAQKEDLFLRPNVTLVLNDLILGHPLDQGSEVLTGNLEYGAIVNILKLKCRQEKLTLKVLDFSFLEQPQVSTDEIVQTIEKALTPKTRMVMLSHILTGTGFRLPIQAIGRMLRQRGVLFIVDGAHGPGALDLNLQKNYDDVDCYAGNLHKWMMGPKGTAFGWVHPQVQDKIHAPYGSWTTETDHSPGRSRFAGADSFAFRMLWSHSQAFSTFFAIEEIIRFWNQLGQKTVLEQISLRTHYLKIELAQLGFDSLVRNKEFESPLLCYNLDQFPKLLLHGLMIQSPEGIPLQVGLPQIPNRKLLRLTPHIHNTKQELEVSLSVFRQALS